MIDRPRLVKHCLAGIPWCCLVLILVGGCNDPSPSPPAASSLVEPPHTDRANGSSGDSLRNQIRIEVDRGNWENARRLVRSFLVDSPDDLDVLKTAALVEGRLGNDAQAAIILHDAIAAGHDSRDLVDLTIRADMQAGRLYECVDLIRQQVARNPDDVRLRKQLIGFLGEAQLMSEIPVHLEALIRARQFDAYLLETTVLQGRRFSLDQINTLSERNSDDARLSIAEVAWKMDQANFPAAAEMSESIIQSRPEFDLGWDLHARSLALMGKFSRLEKVVQSVPATHQGSAHWRFAIGQLRLSQGRLADAIAWNWKALVEQPNDPTILAGLLAKLTQWRNQEAPATADLTNPASLGIEVDPTIDALASRQAGLIDLLGLATKFAYDGHQSPSQAAAISKRLLHLGRHWEAEAWSAIAVQLKTTVGSGEPSDSELADLRTQVVAALADGPNWQADIPHLWPIPPTVLAALQSADKTATETTGIPRSPTDLPNRRPQSATMPPPHETNYRFSDQAKEYGMTYFGHTSDRRAGPMVPLSDSLGCGMGWCDYDRDGRQDVYFAAAGNDIQSQSNQDGALLRLTGNRFRDVTAMANAGDPGFGQGVSIADFNQDGFDDLLVLNFGTNRLFRNNGDGTFEDVTDSMPTDQRWSSSGACLDINGDGLLDWIVCNYLDDDRVDEMCRSPDGEIVPCSPLSFLPAVNQVLAGTANGYWTDATLSWGADPVPGRSLGVTAGKLDGRQIGCLITNDMSDNTYLVESSDHEAADPPECRLANRALFAGLAVDGRGRTQASMGIASDDFDGDGDVDLLVTGFDDEYNVLYRQESPGLWLDCTAEVDLIRPSFGRVGFGCKSIDVDNDGHLELFVSNGHVSEDVNSSARYAEKPDLFRRSPSGRYRRVIEERIGNYFDQPHVGRCVCPVDINRDGRMDLAVTHVTEPPSLLINETPGDRASVAFELVGVTGTRDPIGARVRLDFASGSELPPQTRHRFAGNGYLGSPERSLLLGMARQSHARATVHWPDGTKQSVSEIKAGKRYLWVQGHSPFEVD